MSSFSFTVEIAGIPIAFEAPRPMAIPLELQPFLTDCASAQEVYEIRLLHEPMVFHSAPVYKATGLAVYACGGTSYREFLHLRARDGSTALCCLGSSGRHTLYIPEADWARYERNCSLSALLAPEALFLRHDGFLLHSSVIRAKGRGILFSGPSGVGKSTQAELWQLHQGAEILNGDRCVIRKLGDRFYGYGSPYCGSSGIYRREQVPICAIVLPLHAPENRLERLKPDAALRRLYRECLVNLWDPAFMSKLLDLLQELVLRVPVYALSCRPDARATELLEQEVFGGK